MKTKQLLLSIVAVAVIGGASIFLLNDVDKVNVEINKYQVRSDINSEINQYDANGAAEWLRKRRVNPATGLISEKDLAQAKKSFEISELNRSPEGGDLNWEFVGPNKVGGRTRAFLVDNRDNKTLWAGGVAGGLWKSTTNGLSWLPIGLDELDNIIISSLCQDSDGNIYFGTGESFMPISASNATSTGFEGAGIWKSTDGMTFTRLSATDDYNNFRYVNELIVDPATNNLYAATNYGILLSTDRGETWSNPYSVTGNATDVKISSDGTVVFSMTAIVDFVRKAYVFVSKSGEEPVRKDTQFDTQDSFNRIELAVSPTDPNYMYALCSYNSWIQNKYFNLYQSTDGGENWHSVLQQHTPAVDVFRGNSQGDYDNVITVFPDNPKKVIFGGIDLWTWSEENAFEQISFWGFSTPKQVHSDQHNIYFHPDYSDNEIIYFTNDGGIFASYNSGLTFTAINKNYGVTQYYGIDCGPKGEILGGCQDNGSPYIDLLQPSDPTSSVEITGGDGGYSAISELYPGAIFTTMYHCALYRSNENGAAATMQTNPFDNSGPSSTYNQLAPGNKRNPFVTPINMWESFDYADSKIYLPYVVDTVIEILPSGVPDTVYAFGEGYTFFVESSVVDRKSFEYTITAEDIINNDNDSLRPGDTLAVREKFASLMAIGGAGANPTVGKLFITRNILNFKDENPKWDPIVSSLDHINDDLGIKSISKVQWSPDGAVLYAIGNTKEAGYVPSYGLYRFSGIENAYNYTGPTYDSRIVTNDTTYGVLSSEITDVTLLTSSPINVWSVTYSGTIDNQVVALDTVTSSRVFDLHTSSFDSCNVNVVSDVFEDSISNFTTNTVAYDVYSLDAGTQTVNYITNIDTVHAVNHYMLNMVSLSFSNCIIDTTKNFNTDTITTVTPNSITLDFDSIFTTNLSYGNIYKIDTLLTSDPDTTLKFYMKDFVAGACVLDTVMKINNDTITNYLSYTRTFDYNTILSTTSLTYDSIVRIDTLLTIYDTLLNITYKDTIGGVCNIVNLTGVNKDTVTNLQLFNESVDYYDITLINGINYNNINTIDTVTGVSSINIVSQDTTYEMGVIGPDMVWNNRTVNTMGQIEGKLIKSFSSKIPTSVSIDPKHTNRLVVTVGGFGSHDRVYYTDNATSENPTFTAVDGSGLPDAPIYASLISDTVPSGSHDLILLGTENGVYSTSDITAGTPTWIRETSIPKVPVFHMVQQLMPNGYLKGVCETGVRNSGVIYAGTHGLGAWKMDQYARTYNGIDEIKPEKVDALTVKVFPNPVKSIASIEYNVTKTSDVEIAVYSLTGKLVYRQSIANQYEGTYVHKINVEDFTKGVYVVSLISNNERKVSKFIVE